MAQLKSGPNSDKCKNKITNSDEYKNKITNFDEYKNKIPAEYFVEGDAKWEP